MKKRGFMIYFDNAATGGFKPDCVVSAVNAALKACANPGRSGHALSIACLERVYSVRKILCEFFGGYGYDRVVFTKNCTEALNIAILGGLNAGDEVVCTDAEHNSVLRPLEYLKGRGVRVSYAILVGGEVSAEAVLSLVTPKTRAVIATLASNVTGSAPDIYRLRAFLPENCLLICDGAQACGHVKIDMKKAGIDALAVAGHKGMLGIQGSGALLFSERFNPRPVLFGGTGSESNNLNMPDYYPDALESGTVSYPAIASLGEGALYLCEHMEEHAKSVLEMTSQLCYGLAQNKKVGLFSKPNPYGIVAFNIENMQSEMAAYALSEKYGICVRGGLHCAPLMHRALSSDGLIRASVSFDNSPDECAKLIEAVGEITENG